MKYNSYEIARYIMYLCEQKKQNDARYVYNNTKIQKLLFAVYGTLLARFGKAFIDESPKMWPYGPVFPRVFNKIKEEGFQAKPLVCDCSEEIIEYINRTIDFFGKYSATTLSNWSHEPDSPWSRTREVYGDDWNKDIQPMDIKEYFEEIISHGE